MSPRTKFYASLPVGQWPSLDQALWGAAQNTDPLDGPVGIATRWRPATLENARICYGVWLAWLKATGRLREAVAPGERVAPEVLKNYLEDMRWAEYSEYSSASRLGGLSLALRMLDPTFDTLILTTAAGRVQRAAKRSRDMRMDPTIIPALLARSRLLMKPRASGDELCLKEALDFRDGLLLALLVHRPLRCSNMARIEIGRHLRGGREGYVLAFEASEMKSHRPHRCGVPEKLTKAMQHYLEHVRPVFSAQAGAAGGCSVLWLGRSGRPLTDAGFSAVVLRHSARALGNGIRPHRVRHLVATFLAEDLPERPGASALVLDHQDQSITEGHYVHARASRAAEKLSAALEAIRQGETV